MFIKLENEINLEDHLYINRNDISCFRLEFQGEDGFHAKNKWIIEIFVSDGGAYHLVFDTEQEAQEFPDNTLLNK
jgi:hypothetical protein